MSKRRRASAAQSVEVRFRGPLWVCGSNEPGKVMSLICRSVAEIKRFKRVESDKTD